MLLMFFNPLFGWGSLLAIPDTPAALFWAISTMASLRWIQTKNLRWALTLGIALGIGFNSKYHVALFVPCLLLWITWIRAWRSLPYWHILPLLTLGLLCSFPVLYWNYQHNFDSFIFQLRHGFNSEKPQWIWPLEYVGAQIGLLFPTIVLLTFRRPKDLQERLLYCVGWLPIVFFIWTSLSARPEGNWPILGYPPLLLLAAIQARELLQVRFLHLTVGIWAVAFALVMSEAYSHWVPVSNPKDLKTYEYYRFDEFIPWIESDLPVYASTFQMAATLNFKTRRPVYKLKTLSRKDFYDYLPESAPPLKGKFIVLTNRETDFSHTLLKEYKFLNEMHFTEDKKAIITMGWPTDQVQKPHLLHHPLYLKLREKKMLALPMPMAADP